MTCEWRRAGLGFLTMLLLWQEDVGYWPVGLGYAFVGVGVGFAGTPASHSLTGSVPVTRVGMASGTADLQRDLGGAILQSVFGALLTAGYADALSAKLADAPASTRNLITSNVRNELTKSFASAAQVARQYPKYSQEVIAAARSAFLQGDHWAYAAGIVAVLLGAAIVRFYFPPKRAEHALLDAYQAKDRAATAQVRAASPD
jgi:DHA2 family multidrug resistance protein-like MFS transporter